ncbi:proline--tRNA ligase [Candidatus Woesearchaeota archaeon]|nr:proline--tRNA ligase [Candidatus Woesearchaeota archaeon]
MSKKKESELGLTATKDKDFSQWYTQVIQKAELIEYTDVSGCIIFRPYSYAIWEKIQAYMDKLIKVRGIKNAYFPLFIPEKLLCKEADHVQGFIPEVAWVTHAGKTKLKERLAVRPTSETIMYDAYKKWIRSHRDLPLKINQWNNVVRWEFKHPVPFLRTREFLWQEGHTAFATKQEADTEAMDILKDVYSKTLVDLLAIPSILGKKSEKEKFAGADYSLSCETYLANNKAIQACTSHHLGQNFSKAFDISFLDENEKKQYVWQNSWGFTTRSIGIAIMMHSDDKGLVLPPKIAPTQAVVVPILFEKTKDKLLKESKKIVDELKGVSVHLDDREEYTPGFKYNEWELKGVPVRIEFGPKDMEKKHTVVVRRDTGKKEFVKLKDLSKYVNKTLDDIQDSLYKKAEKFLNDSKDKANNWNDFLKKVKQGKLTLAPFCNTLQCEDHIKDKTGGTKSINIPFDSKVKKGEKCIQCKKDATDQAYFAKSY